MYKRLLAVLCLLWVPALLWARPCFRLTVLNVGQGLSAVAESPDGKVLVFDCGSESGGFESKNGNRTARYLRQRGRRRIDLLILSHPDADHSSGIVELAREFTIGSFLSPDVPGPAMTDVRKELRRRHTPCGTLRAGQSFRLGKEVVCRAVAGGTSTETNSGSAAVLLSVGDTGFLLTADMGKREEYAMCSRFGSALRADVLLAPHHGSAGSCSETLLRTVRPKLLVISCGADNKYGHPAPETLKRASELRVPWLVTCQKGDIILISDGKRAGLLRQDEEQLRRFLKRPHAAYLPPSSLPNNPSFPSSSESFFHMLPMALPKAGKAFSVMVLSMFWLSL